MSVVFRI